MSPIIYRVFPIRSPNPNRSPRASIGFLAPQSRNRSPIPIRSPTLGRGQSCTSRAPLSKWSRLVAVGRGFK
jgi:hypothetical protein